MWAMAKKKAKSVKSKTSKHSAKKRPARPARPVKKTSSRAAARRVMPKKRTKQVTKKAAKPVSKKTPKAVAKKVVKVAAKKVVKGVAKKVVKPLSKKTSKAQAEKVAKASPALAKAAPRPTVGIRRRDGSGHLDPKYAADLLRQSGQPESEGVGFLAHARSSDDLAEALGEQFIEGATTGEGAAEEDLDQEVPEERGGPFVRSNAGTEFAEGTDRSNPKGAKREPFPTT
jgi:hypothetical protein